MSYRRPLLLSCVAALAVTASVNAAPQPVELNPSDAMPAAPVPIVPLPPALIGAGASIALATVLRMSRHRRWITLR